MSKADRGADGPAMERRASYSMPGADAGVEVRVMCEPGPLAGLGLSQRQVDAAAELARCWREARPFMELPAGYGGRGGACRDNGAAEGAEVVEAWRRYVDGLDALQWACGVLCVAAVRAAVLHGEPAEGQRVRRGLAALADHWGL